MLNKLKEVKERYLNIEKQLSLPETVSDNELYKKLMRDYKELTPVMEKYGEYEKMLSDFQGADELRQSEADPDMRALAEEEYYSLKEILAKTEEELKILLLPKDPNDDKNVVVEIRAGAGGEEAALFAGVLYRMYTMFAESHRFKTELMSVNETGLGGYKEITFTVSGEGAYSRLKYESGVHRVQRVPETESSGRIHTSTATVAVLPEAEDVEVEINPQDLVVETCKSSGAGGQHVNKTESAIRIIHKPTGIIVECQDERSQFKNKDKAMKLLRAKLYDMKQREQTEKIAGERKMQVGSGDRSERIRTYNFPQGRISDHRIQLTLYTLESFVNGELDEVIDALATADNAERLKGG
ncbi:MAG: peptide chain release factor 1 [Ruminococcaceae bacterium]|nr:peptide chain release factor 1 [Oscillospiraceae bacterium]